MKEFAKNAGSFLLRFGLSAGLLVFLFRKIDLAKMGELCKTADYGYLALAGLVFFVIHAVIFLRWIIFIRALDLQLPFKETVSFFFIGLFFNLFLPSSTGGDLVKAFGLCQYTKEKGKVVASIVLDRLSGFAAIVLVAMVAYILGFQLIRDWSLLISIFILAGVVALILAVLLNERIYSFGCNFFNGFPKFKEALMHLHYQVAMLKKKKYAFYQAVGLSVVTQTLLSLTFYFAALGLHAQTRFVYFLIFVPLLCVISSLPSIGGLGVRDAGAAYLFGKVGMGTATAVSVSLFNFFLMIAVGLIGGIIFLVYLMSGNFKLDLAAIRAEFQS